MTDPFPAPLTDAAHDAARAMLNLAPADRQALARAMAERRDLPGGALARGAGLWHSLAVLAAAAGDHERSVLDHLEADDAPVAELITDDDPLPPAA